jgi:4-diphosphocytidyl-2-C-methyl-D-erythritol kinase
VFKALGLAPGEQLTARSPSTTYAHEGDSGQAPRRDALLAWLASERNDLESAAIMIAPQIADVLRAITELAGCRLARMSGSGSACFGLFDSARATATAARQLAAARPSWWVRAGVLGN